MNFRHILAAAALAAAVLLPTGARAQADTTLVSTALWTACPGATVRLALRDAETVIGRCGPVAEGRLLVQTQDTARQIELSEVRGLWMRKSRIAEATVFLGLLGAAVGAYVRGPISSCFVGECPDSELAAERGHGAALGAVAGAAAGLLVGSRLKHWQQRYP